MRARGPSLARTPRWTCSALAVIFVVFACDVADAATVPCTTICSGTSGNCNVSGTITIAPGSTIDCTGRPVFVDNLATLKVEDGSMKLLASTLTVYPSAVMKAIQVAGGGSLGVEVETTGAIAIYGSLQADAAAGGGSIKINAGGNVTVVDDGDKGIEASGTAANADGGEITIRSGGSIYVNDPVRAESGSAGTAGGGRIELRATTDVVISGTGAKLFVDGRKTDAGTIDVTAGHDITVASTATLEADGRQDGGNGGGVYLTAGNKVTLGSAVSARGGVGAGGGSSAGGELHVESGCGGVAITGNIDIRGGELGAGIDGGAVEIETLGDLTIGTGVLIDTHAVGNAGNGGDVKLTSGKKLTLGGNAKIDTRGDTSSNNGDGAAGSVELTGCEVETGAGAIVDAKGIAGGTVVIDAASDGAVNPTAMHINGTSSFDASGTAAGEGGTIWVAVGKERLTGTCSTNGQPCTLDANCTVGCTPGQCDGLNPDTDNVLTQFISDTDIREDVNIVACASGCNP